MQPRPGFSRFLLGRWISLLFVLLAGSVLLWMLTDRPVRLLSVLPSALVLSTSIWFLTRELKVDLVRGVPHGEIDSWRAVRSSPRWVKIALTCLAGGFILGVAGSAVLFINRKAGIMIIEASLVPLSLLALAMILAIIFRLVSMARRVR